MYLTHDGRLLSDFGPDEKPPKGLVALEDGHVQSEHDADEQLTARFVYDTEDHLLESWGAFTTAESPVEEPVSSPTTEGTR